MDQAGSLRKLVDQRIAEKARRPLPATASPRVLSVTSGKGGVGKTNIVGNLAVAFARKNMRVLVLDADLGLANIDIIFGVYPKYNIGDVINGERSLTEVMEEGPAGVKIIPAGSGFVNLTNLTEGQKLSLISEFEALDEVFDVFLIDTGAGIGGNVVYFNLAAQDCIVVATNEPTSITDAYAVMKVMSTRHGKRRFKLLVNMVSDESEARAVYANLSQAVDRFLSDIVLEYLGSIPFDRTVSNAVRARKPFILSSPASPVSKRLNRIAGELISAPPDPDKGAGIRFFFERYVEYPR